MLIQAIVAKTTAHMLLYNTLMLNECTEQKHERLVSRISTCQSTLPTGICSETAHPIWPVDLQKVDVICAQAL